MTNIFLTQSSAVMIAVLALTASPPVTQSFSLNQPAAIANRKASSLSTRVVDCKTSDANALSTAILTHSSEYRLNFFPWKQALSRPIRTPVYYLSMSNNNHYKEEDDAEDDDSNGSEPWVNRNLGIDIGSQLEPLSPSEAEKLKREATDTINAAFDERLAEIQNLKEQVRRDFETSREAMRFASDLRAAEQTEKLMDKIDRLSQDFLDENKELRSGIKLAARADRNMVGKGLDFGSWGQVGGMNVLTSVGGMDTAGLLGSVGAARLGEGGERDGNNIYSGTTESMIEVNTRVKGGGGGGGESEQRIMVICDESDKNFKKVLNRFEELVSDRFSDSVIVDTYSPSSVIPMGGNNAKCAIIVSTSLSNGQASAENILGRVLKKTLAAGGGGVSKPPSHFVVVSPVGTERIEQFPYSMQNMMGGGRLKKAREVEEVVTSIVKRRFTADSSVPPLDYTILKLGELVEDSKIVSGKDGLINVKPGDSLDGKVGIDAAAQVLLQAVALRPTARNATLSVIGGMDKNQVVEEEMWEDWFLRLEGPELWRSEPLAQGDQELERKFEELASYINEWSNRYKDGAKGTGLTTPVSVFPSKFGPDVDTSSANIRRKFGVRLEFKQTNTGSAYRSKEEERQMEREIPSKSTTKKDQVTTMKQKKQGGVEILVEEVVPKEGLHQLRVRAKRCNMDDDTVLKEMSEATILKSLEEATRIWKER